MDSSLHAVREEEEEEDRGQHRPASVSVSGAEVSEMEKTGPEVAAAVDEASLSTTWEWGSLLDFAIDEPSILSWDSEDRVLELEEAPAPEPATAPISQSQLQSSSSSSGRVRKRDPRLTCENFLAGRVPCACPELDEKDEEGEQQQIGKKRARRAPSGAGAQCQVPGCEADIRELKGYHRRHRVCLRCANATAVMLCGQMMRYCQQCGKFHILSDFDEGKRSCRRKLERHNNRRRRKSIDTRSVAEKDSNEIFPADDAPCDDEIGRDTEMLIGSMTDDLCLANQLKDSEILLESEEGHGSAFCSVPMFQNIQSNSLASFVSSAETQMDDGKDFSKPSLSSSFCNNKCAYSSVCPTGRMSFKLYDWNPAEFPRRLRHQIFQWLASMPIELEGYIRPGCTILTLFIAMPRFMWVKLSEDAFTYVNDLVNAPESLLSGRSTMRVYLNDMIFQVLKDGRSLINVKMAARAPRLHYVHPSYFEAGKPMEFVVCGNNLLQPKFRLLVSFAGKYLAYESCLAIPQKNRALHAIGSLAAHSFDHEIFKIYIPDTELKLFGPAFIEVENESGLSNFIPVLIGDRKVCSELQMISQRFDNALSSGSISTQFADIDDVLVSCQFYVSKQIAISELLLDVAWLLKEPQPDKSEILLTPTHVQRLNCLLRFLIENKCVSILERISQSITNVMEIAQLRDDVKTNHADINSLQKYMVQAREVLHSMLQRPERPIVLSGNCSEMIFPEEGDINSGLLRSVPRPDRGVDVRMEGKLISKEAEGCHIYVPLINKDIFMDVNSFPHPKKGFGWPQKACSHILSSSIRRSHLVVFSVAAVAVCFGICVALSHPHEVRRIAVSMRRCLFGASST